MSESIKGRIVFLDYMRVFAFVSVLIGHKFFETIVNLAADSSQHITIRYLAEALIPLCMGGAAGVVVFFFTSGYIITHVLQTEATADFLIKRIFRIYPLYIVAVVAQAAMEYMVEGIPIPPASVWIPRLLLIGDFFDTPYALAGVEWTLRIEIVFYAFMALLKGIGVFRVQQALPQVFIIATAALFLASPFPSEPQWSYGYLTIYAPFLFVGSCIYLVEAKLASSKTCIIAVTLIVLAFAVLIAKIQPGWKESHYMLFALMIFIAGWMAKGRLSDGPIIRLFAELTYAVYLLHNWVWHYLTILVEKFSSPVIPYQLQVLILLLLICYVANKTIENGGLRLGRITLRSYKTFVSSSAFVKALKLEAR